MSTVSVTNLKHESASGNNVTLDSNGRVGVNNASPAYQVDVVRSGGGTDVMRLKGNAGNAFIRFEDATAASHFTVGADNGGPSGSGSFVIYDQNASAYRFLMDSSGRVTMPYQPFFYALRSGDQTGYNAESQGDVVVIYNNAGTNIGNHYNTATGKFTAPVNGIYVFVGGAYSATQTFSQSWLVINGSRGAATDWQTNASGNFTVNATMIQLSANDTVGFHPYAGGATNATITATPYHTYFRGYLLG